MAMYEEQIFGRNKSSHPGVDDLNMNTVTVLGDPSPFPAAESGKMSFVLKNLDGRVDFVFEFRFTNASWTISQG